ALARTACGSARADDAYGVKRGDTLDPDTKVVARAQRRLARTKRHVSPRIQAIQQGRIKRARKAMVEAAEALEKNFSPQPIEVLTPEAYREDATPSQAEGEAGHWELKFRPPKLGI
ncbi:hypothetical protein VDQ90_21665, partial [Xanthomonas campestris pv. campestris]|nr:hypothetical protein [Xanthomonas campestris pv. campestris]